MFKEIQSSQLLYASSGTYIVSSSSIWYQSYPYKRLQPRNIPVASTRLFSTLLHYSLRQNVWPQEDRNRRCTSHTLTQNDLRKQNILTQTLPGEREHRLLYPETSPRHQQKNLHNHRLAHRLIRNLSLLPANHRQERLLQRCSLSPVSLPRQ